MTSYNVTITASDGSLTGEQDLTVQIQNVVEQYTLDPVDLARAVPSWVRGLTMSWMDAGLRSL